jgi:hypothetical protein
MRPPLLFEQLAKTTPIHENVVSTNIPSKPLQSHHLATQKLTLIVSGEISSNDLINSCPFRGGGGSHTAFALLSSMLRSDASGGDEGGTGSNEGHGLEVDYWTGREGR